MAAGAGVSVGTVQYYFSSKEALLEGCLDGYHDRLREAAMGAMSSIGQTVQPAQTTAAAAEGQSQYHERKYAVYRRMCDDQLAYRAIMEGRG